MEGIHEILEAIDSSTEEDVLATIVHVEGSAYRKEGTSMLFKQDGTKIGLISAGCLEVDLSYRVNEFIKKKETGTIVYDMQSEDDLSWGQGAGCNGKIHVLLEPVNATLRKHLCQLKSHLASRERVTMIKKLDTTNTVTAYLFVTDQHLFGEWHDPSSVEALARELHQSAAKSGMIYSQELSSTIYIHSFSPKPRLIVFGAGPDAVPLVKLASNTGFSVIVVDWRSTCNEKTFPDADQLFVGFPEEFVSTFSFYPSDSVVLLTHHFHRDKEILHQLKNRELLYFGVLGSTNRTKRLLDGQEIPARIKSPAGLMIGAEGPEEIAVSIVAELIQQMRLWSFPIPGVEKSIPK